MGHKLMTCSKKYQHLPILQHCCWVFIKLKKNLFGLILAQNVSFFKICEAWRWILLERGCLTHHVQRWFHGSWKIVLAFSSIWWQHFNRGFTSALGNSFVTLLLRTNKQVGKLSSYVRDRLKCCRCLGENFYFRCAVSEAMFSNGSIHRIICLEGEDVLNESVHYFASLYLIAFHVCWNLILNYIFLVIDVLKLWRG